MKEFEDLCDITKKEFGVSKEELISKSRIRPLVELRGICSNILCEETNYTLKDIGDKMNVDHATIIHYQKTHKALLSSLTGKVYTENFELLLHEFKKRQYRFGTLSELLHKKALIESSINKEFKDKGEIGMDSKVSLDYEQLYKISGNSEIPKLVFDDFIKIFNAQYGTKYSISKWPKEDKAPKKIVLSESNA